MAPKATAAAAENKAKEEAASRELFAYYKTRVGGSSPRGSINVMPAVPQRFDHHGMHAH